MPIQMRSSMVEYGFAMAVLRWKGQKPFGRFRNGPLVSIANNPSTARIQTVLLPTTFACKRKDIREKRNTHVTLKLVSLNQHQMC